METPRFPTNIQVWHLQQVPGTAPDRDTVVNKTDEDSAELGGLSLPGRANQHKTVDFSSLFFRLLFQNRRNGAG